MMNLVAPIGIWFVGLIMNLGVRLDYPQEDDTHTAVGKSILWPLYVIRFFGIALWKGALGLVE
jgi:fumarate reductase subunit D